MKEVYVNDLKIGDTISSQTFVLAEVKAATDKNGNPYYDVVIADKMGQMRGKIWSDAISNVEVQSVKSGKVVAIDGSVGEYKGQPQVTITSLHGVDESKLEDYLETSMFPADDMWKELEAEVASVGNKSLQQLLNNVLGNEELGKKLKYWPAAVTVHHSFRSGLLQHILEMLTTAKGLERFFPQVDMDVLKTGIILHDIGKLRELDASGMTTSYTKIGALIGHITLGVQILEEHLPKDFPEKLYIHLKHIILSHHGLKEHGSPVLPATVEALLIHNIDKVSADARNAADTIGKAALDERGLTEYNTWLQTRLWGGTS